MQAKIKKRRTHGGEDASTRSRTGWHAILPFILSRTRHVAEYVAEVPVSSYPRVPQPRGRPVSGKETTLKNNGRQDSSLQIHIWSSRLIRPPNAVRRGEFDETHTPPPKTGIRQIAHVGSRGRVPAENGKPSHSGSGAAPGVKPKRPCQHW